jgi:hypothetical protein
LLVSLNLRDRVHGKIRGDKGQFKVNGNVDHDSLEGLLQTDQSGMEKRLGSVTSRCMGLSDSSTLV